jgi:hypothetical protein
VPPKRKIERAHISSLTTHLLALEQKEANSPKRSRRQEIIKFRGKINQWKQELFKESTKRGAGKKTNTFTCYYAVSSK